MATNSIPIVGVWETEFHEDGALQKERVTVKQSKRNDMVEGLIELLDSKNENATLEKYEFWGKYKGKMLTGVYFPADKNEFEQGAFVLEHISKNVLEGKYIFYLRNPQKKKPTEKIITSDYKWKRQNVSKK
jgi:hypothetical protein